MGLVTFYVKILLPVALLCIAEAGNAQVLSRNGEVQRRVYKKVSSDSLRLRNKPEQVKAKGEKVSAKGAAKTKKSKVDSLQYSSRNYQLGERVIMLGDSGRDVRSVAKILVNKLYMDELDIIYTADGGVLYEGELVKAVKRFQRLNGFHEDGIVGRELIKALRKRSAGGK